MKTMPAPERFQPNQPPILRRKRVEDKNLGLFPVSSKHEKAKQRALAACLGAALWLWGGGLCAEPLAPDETAIRRALADRLDSQTGKTPATETAILPGEARRIVRDKLDAALLRAVRAISGSEFRFIPRGESSEAQIAVLILSYPDEGAADRMAEKLAATGGYFRRTKILTPFSFATIGDRLAIVFTENAGDANIVRLIREIPEWLTRRR